MAKEKLPSLPQYTKNPYRDANGNLTMRGKTTSSTEGFEQKPQNVEVTPHPDLVKTSNPGDEVWHAADEARREHAQTMEALRTYPGGRTDIENEDIGKQRDAVNKLYAQKISEAVQQKMDEVSPTPRPKTSPDVIAKRAEYAEARKHFDDYTIATSRAGRIRGVVTSLGVPVNNAPAESKSEQLERMYKAGQVSQADYERHKLKPSSSTPVQDEPKVVMLGTKAAASMKRAYEVSKLPKLTDAEVAAKTQQRADVERQQAEEEKQTSVFGGAKAVGSNERRNKPTPNMKARNSFRRVNAQNPLAQGADFYQKSKGKKNKGGSGLEYGQK